MKEMISKPVAGALIAIVVVVIGFLIYRGTGGKPGGSPYGKTPPAEAQKWLPSNTMKNARTGSQAPPPGAPGSGQ